MSDYDEDDQPKKNNNSRELELLGIRNIMKTENGRSFMWRSLQNCGTFENMYSKDTHEHAFNAGKRSHGLWLNEELKVSATDDYFKMLKENYNG